MADDKSKSKSLSNFGGEYIVPKGMSKKQYIELQKKWNQKLKNSGFFDIEDFDVQNGTTSPFLYAAPDSNEISGSHFTISARIKPAQAEYYRLASMFNECADFVALFGESGGLCRTYKYIWNLHAQGKSYRHILHKYNVMRRRNVRKTKSIFWLHTHMMIITEAMYTWHKTDALGAYADTGETAPDWFEVYVESIRQR